MSGQDDFWKGYAQTLARVRADKPTTVNGVAMILNAFQKPSAGVAFFGNNADDRLSHALADAGWDITYLESDYLWQARNRRSGEWIHFIEGDVKAGQYRRN